MDANELFQQAREARSTGDFEKAAQLYERVISDHHASEEAELSRAHLYNVCQGTESGSQSSEATPTTVSHGGGTTQDVVITDTKCHSGQWSFFYGEVGHCHYPGHHYSLHHRYHAYRNVWRNAWNTQHTQPVIGASVSRLLEAELVDI
ncbi:MAG: hypothetical protein MN733_11265 [Nitrososphaera sp.]|nr:hypothetical protein [Nitrososphaera sp.]